jgi:hypothetical protein
VSEDGDRLLNRRRIIVLAVVAALFSAGTAGTAVYELIFSAKRSGKPHFDFAMYHGAATAAADGKDIYSFHEKSGDMPYPYPPLLASTMVPLSKLSLMTAYAIWCALLFMCLAGTVFVTSRILEELKFTEPILGAIAALPFVSVLLDSNYYWGQVNLLVALISGLAILAGLRGQWLRAGVFIGIAGAMKVLPGLLIIWLLARRRWAAAGAAVGSALFCLMLVPAILGGGFAWAWSMNMNWLELFFSALSKGSDGLQSNGGYVVNYKNGSINAILDRFFGGSGATAIVLKLSAGTIKLISTVIRGLLLLATVAVAVRAALFTNSAVEKYKWPLAAVMLTLSGWLANLLMWDHHTITILVMAPIVLAAVLDRDCPTPWRGTLLVGLAAIVIGFASGYTNGTRRFGLQTATLLLLWSSVCWSLWTSGRYRQSAESTAKA